MCGPLFLTVASFGLLSVGACLGFVTAALFAAGTQPADLPKPKPVVLIPDDSAEVVWQAAASLYLLGECLDEGENPFGAMADAARALHRVADRFPGCYTRPGFPQGSARPSTPSDASSVVSRL